MAENIKIISENINRLRLVINSLTNSLLLTENLITPIETNIPENIAIR